MPGRPEFSQPGTRGGGQTVAVSNRPEIEVISATATQSIAAGNVEEINVYAPPGSVYNLLNLYMDVNPPPGAGTGQHGISIRGAEQSYGAAIRGISNFGDEIRWQYNEWVNSTADGWPKPSDTSACVLALKNVRATEDEPIKIKYRNNTDVEQTNERTITMTVEEESY